MKNIIAQGWGLLLLAIAWQIWIWSTGFNAIVMPSPSAVLTDLAGHPGAYLGPLAATAAVAFIGTVGGLALGFALAVATWLSRVLGGIILPLGLIFSSVPVVCLIPILARLFGYGEQTVAAIVIVLTFFPAFIYTSAGLRASPAAVNDLFRVLGAGRATILMRLALPAAMPNMVTALRIAAAQSIVAAIVGEFLMGATGLGHLFVVTHLNLQMDRAVGAALVAAMMSTLCYAVTAGIETRVRSHWT
jgi:ABC-type nitrate/sulfonate/bicarbonate transport system permease component